jgi:Protein of unknown function (DUF3168)
MSLITSVRQAILPALKANSAITAIVPADRIYPSKTPSAIVYPFIRYGQSSLTPHSLSCWKAGTVSGSVHCFVQASDVILDPDAKCGDLAEAIADCIGGINEGFAASVQVIPDSDEPDVYHGIVFFDVTRHDDRP